MADLSDLAYGKFKGYPYYDNEFMEFLTNEGYVNVKVGDTDVPDHLINTSVARMKRFIISKDGETKTLFIALDAMGVYDFFYLRDGIVYSLNEKKPLSEITASDKQGAGLAMMIALAFFIFVGMTFHYIFKDFGDSDDYNYDDEPTYYYDSDDKDYDGDVDYDDVEKYLEDSLEEDKNDGDDW